MSVVGRLALIGMAALLPLAPAAAAVPAIEERGAAERQWDTPAPAGASPVVAAPAPRAAASASRGDALGELFYELQVLQQEVLELRGMVEEQAHRLDRMAAEQRQRYLDIDRRLTGQRPAPDADPGADAGNAGARDSAAAAPQSEEAAYEAAFALTRQRSFEAAIAAFQRLLKDYPTGTYAPNAYYWLGELYLALPEPQLELARSSFAQVVNAFPGHPKVPDAMYKLGVVYDRLGDADRARAYLERVQRDYPTSSAAKLAATYAAAL